MLRICAGVAVSIGTVAVIVHSGCGPGDDCEVTLTCPLSSGGAGAEGGSGGAGTAGDGTGGDALLANGEPCGAASECESASCADGFCCESACDAVCVTCAAASAEGTCSAQPVGTDPDGDCPGGSCDPLGTCALGTHRWSFKYGTVDSQLGMGIATDPNDNVIITGDVRGSIDVGGGVLAAQSGDILLAKLGADGSYAWGKLIGDGSIQRGVDVAATTSGAVFLAAEIQGGANFGGGVLTSAGLQDIVVARFNPDGSYDWAQRFGDTTSQRVTAIAATGESAVIAGHFAGTVNFGGQPLTAEDFGDVYVARFAGNGNQSWSHDYGVQGNHQALDVAVDSLGEVIVVGYFNGQVNFGGLLKISISEDIFVLKLDAGGNYLWDKDFGSGDDQSASGVAVDADRNIIVVGEMSGSTDFGDGTVLTSADSDPDAFVAKYDRDGTHLWSIHFGAAGEDRAKRTAVDADGNIFVVGEFENAIDLGGGELMGDDDVFIVKLSPDGIHLWSRAVGNDQFQFAADVATTPTNDVVFIGDFAGTINLGGSDLTSFDATIRDIFLAKLGP